MSAFAWFHNGSDRPAAAVTFYQRLLGWKPIEGPAGMKMFAGDAGPFAGIGAAEGQGAGWIPYVLVADVDEATARAVELGAAVIQARTPGPAGDFAVLRDPGGAAVALWQKRPMAAT